MTTLQIITRLREIENAVRLGQEVEAHIYKGTNDSTKLKRKAKCVQVAIVDTVSEIMELVNDLEEAHEMEIGGPFPI